MKTTKDTARHLRNLERIFPSFDYTDWGQLRALERRAHALAEAHCNGELGEEELNASEEEILDLVDDILGFRSDKVEVFLNMDPRGYALKISNDWIRLHVCDLERDWGGYGIVCPDGL